ITPTTDFFTLSLHDALPISVIRINPGVDRGSVHDCGAGINRMMILKYDAGLCQLPKRGRILLADKIWAHAVPNHDHHMFAMANPDRKSTRLNSSHLVISYAV